MKDNLLHSIREKIVEDIDTKMKQLRMVEKETEVVFECDTRQLEQTISMLGELLERDVSTPYYPALLQPSVSVGKGGRAKGQFNCPRGVAVNEKTKLIYVADGGSFNETGNISVFSLTGEYIDRFCEGRVKRPYGIVLSGDNHVLVTDRGSHCVYKFKLLNSNL